MRIHCPLKERPAIKVSFTVGLPCCQLEYWTLVPSYHFICLSGAGKSQRELDRQHHTSSCSSWKRLTNASFIFADATSTHTAGILEHAQPHELGQVAEGLELLPDELILLCVSDRQNDCFLIWNNNAWSWDGHSTLPLLRLHERLVSNSHPAVCRSPECCFCQPVPIGWPPAGRSSSCSWRESSLGRWSYEGTWRRHHLVWWWPLLKERKKWINNLGLFKAPIALTHKPAFSLVELKSLNRLKSIQ